MTMRKVRLDMTMSDHLVGVASLVSGIPSLVEVCLHLRDFVVTRLEAYEEISDTVLRLATYWDIGKAALGKPQKICASTTLTQEVDDRLTQILEWLRRLLTKAASLLAKYAPTNGTASAPELKHSKDALERLRYILFKEKQLAHLLEQIAEWGTSFQQTSYPPRREGALQHQFSRIVRSL
jgi:hypothetical protein